MEKIEILNNDHFSPKSLEKNLKVNCKNFWFFIFFSNRKNYWKITKILITISVGKPHKSACVRKSYKKKILLHGTSTDRYGFIHDTPRSSDYGTRLFLTTYPETMRLWFFVNISEMLMGRLPWPEEIKIEKALDLAQDKKWLRK